MADRDNERRQWHLDKTFNVGHLLTTIGLAAALAGYVTTMDKRVAVLESQYQMHSQTTVTMQTAQKELSREIRDEIKGLRAEIIEVVKQQVHERRSSK